MKRILPVLVLFLLPALPLSGCTAASESRRPVSTASAPPVAQVQFVRFKTEDGLTLSGRVFGRGRVGIILGHMYPADQKSWSESARALSARGYKVLTFDFRGYGLSGGVKEIPKIDQDMQAALDYLRQTNDDIFLIGASMGGTAALKVASKNQVAGVATVSAPAEFMGLGAGNIRDIKGPKLFMAAAGDNMSPETARRFYAEAGEPKEIQILTGADHGTDMMQDPDSEALRLLVDWLKRYD